MGKDQRCDIKAEKIIKTVETFMYIIGRVDLGDGEMQTWG
jgi:hypothetical protein